jgi:hypothetical protein
MLVAPLFVFAVSVNVSPIKITGTHAYNKPDFPHIGRRFANHIFKLTFQLIVHTVHYQTY